LKNGGASGGPPAGPAEKSQCCTVLPGAPRHAGGDRSSARTSPGHEHTATADSTRADPLLNKRMTGLLDVRAGVCPPHPGRMIVAPVTRTPPNLTVHLAHRNTIRRGTPAIEEQTYRRTR
jgi:hypothetical protein